MMSSLPSSPRSGRRPGRRRSRRRRRCRGSGRRRRRRRDGVDRRPARTGAAAFGPREVHRQERRVEPPGDPIRDRPPPMAMPPTAPWSPKIRSLPFAARRRVAGGAAEDDGRYRCCRRSRRCRRSFWAQTSGFGSMQVVITSGARRRSRASGSGCSPGRRGSGRRRRCRRSCRRRRRRRCGRCRGRRSITSSALFCRFVVCSDMSSAVVCRRCGRMQADEQPARLVEQPQVRACLHVWTIAVVAEDDVLVVAVAGCRCSDAEPGLRR